MTVHTNHFEDFFFPTFHSSIFSALKILMPNPIIIINNFSLQDQSDSRSLSDSLDNIPSNVFGPEGIVTRFTLPLSYGRKEARQKRLG